MDNESLVEAVRTNTVYSKVISPRHEAVLAAMSEVDRRHFLPDGINAYRDEAVWIGYSQTCSEPSVVAFMDDVLELRQGMKVLEVGTGCGYHAAVTSRLIGRDGHLVTIEYIPALADVARRNLAAHFGEELESRVTVVQGDGSIGYKAEAPYDRIYLTAGVMLRSFKPHILAEQLKPEGGILVFPQILGGLFKQTYKDGKKREEEYFFGFIFVPLRGENGLKLSL